MATQKEIARFFQLALRSGLVETMAIERWADSVIAAEPVARHPITELAGASRMSRSIVDELLGQVTGHCELHVPGRIVLALLRRHLRDRTVTPDAAIKLALEIGFAGPLTDEERHRADGLDDSLLLAANGTYGTLDDVRQEVAEFLERYAEFDDQIPVEVNRHDK